MTRTLIFPYNSDSGKAGQVTIRSRIRIVGGDPLPLQEDFLEEVEQGSGWEGLVTTSGHQLIDDRRAASFEVHLPDSMTLATFAELIIPRKPVRVKVTLTPDIQAPAPGMPVPVQAPFPSRTSVVSIEIPEMKPGMLDLETLPLPDDPSGRPRGALRARVRFPSVVRPTADEHNTVRKSISFHETDGKSAVDAGAIRQDGDEWVIREYTALADREVMSRAQVMVEVTATVCNQTLRALARISFDIKRVFQPYIVPHRLAVTKDAPASFTALVREVREDGREADVPDSSVSVTLPGSAAGHISLQPQTATGTLNATVSLLKAGMEGAVTCPVVFEVGKERFEDAVTVKTGTHSGPLEAEFVPTEKTTINPFLPSDSVTIRARVKSSPAVISFTRGDATRWLDEPSIPVPAGEGWVAVRIEASPPDPESRDMPPESEPVIITATDKGTVIAEERVPVRFTSPPLLDASPGAVRVLAGKEGGNKSSEEKVVLTLHGEHQGTWTFGLEGDEEASRYLSISEPVVNGLSATFSIGLSGEMPPPARTVGPSSWETVYRLHSRATGGTVEIEGPDVQVIVLREGLFVEKIFAVDEKNQYKTSDRMTVLPIRVDLPTDDRKRVARVKFVALVWDGTDIVPDEDAVRGENLSWDPPVCTAEDGSKWESIFQVLKAGLVTTDQDEIARTLYSDLAGSWGISLDKVIPGHGENLQGEITATCEAGSVTIPLVLRLGEPPDEKTLAIEKEKARCERLIRGCIPEPYRQKILDDLELLPGKGARDYQVYARSVYETAWTIWAEDQKDYQYWENGWGYYLFKGAEYAKGAGDIAFSILVGYATSSLGPAYSYGASTMASEFKDQGLELYAYYVQHSDTKDFGTCVVDFVNERLTGFMIALASGAVDTVILKGIDIKNPKTYTRLAWLWLWKVQVNYARNPDAGLVEAMIAGGKEVAMAASMMLLQKFVGEHGDSNLKDIYSSVKKKGLLGGKTPGHAEEGEPAEGRGKKKVAVEEEGKKKVKKQEKEPGKKEEKGKTPGEEAEKKKGPGEKKGTEKKPASKGQKPTPGKTNVGKSIKNLKAKQASSKNECGEVYDAEGNLIHSQEGDPTSINWDVPPEKMKGGTVIHTHPNIPGKPGKPREIGGPHSGADLAEAVNNQMGESIVVGEGKVYSVKVNNSAIEKSPKYKGNSRGKLALEVKTAYEQALKDLKPSMVQKGNEQVKKIKSEKGSVSPEEVNAIKENIGLEWKEKAVKRATGQFGEFITLETQSG